MDALKRARAALAARVADPKARFIPGLTDDLRTIAAAFEEVDRRTSVLATVLLRAHYWPGSVPADELAALEAFGAEPATVARQAKHGKRCTCSDCMGGG